MKKGRKQGICTNPKCGQQGELRAHDLCSKCEPRFRTRTLPPDVMDMVYEHIQTQKASKNKLDEMLDELNSKKKEVEDSVRKLQLALKMGIHVEQTDIDTLADISNRYLRALLPEETESESETQTHDDEETESEIADVVMPPEVKADVEAQTQTQIEPNKHESEPSPAIQTQTHGEENKSQSPAIQTQTRKHNAESDNPQKALLLLAAPVNGEPEKSQPVHKSSQMLRHEAHLENGVKVVGCPGCEQAGRQPEPGVKERVIESLITQGLAPTEAIHYENEAVGVVFNDRLINAVNLAMNDWPLIEKLRVKKSLNVVNAWKYFSAARTLLPDGDDDAIIAKACELADIGCSTAGKKKKK